jgi:hypothetical protein
MATCEYERRRTELRHELERIPVAPVAPTEAPSVGADPLREEMRRIVGEREERRRLEQRRREVAAMCAEDLARRVLRGLRLAP